MEEMKLSCDEYDTVVEKYREQNEYGEMSDDEKFQQSSELEECGGDDPRRMKLE